MRKILFVLAVIPFLAHAEIPEATPHVAGAEEISPFGFPGVLIAKIVFEAAAQGYRDAGDKETCQAIAAGARSGSWLGAGATLGGLAAGPYGLAIQSAIDTC